jgi:hypothetical protein
VALLLLFVGATAAPGGAASDPGLLRDGFVLTGIEGRVSGPQEGEPNHSIYTGLRGRDLWFFESYSDVNDGRVVLKAGTRLEMLPSVALENMVVDINELAAASYVVWARVTTYKGRNFILPYYFMRLVEPQRGEQGVADRPGTSREPNEPEAAPKEAGKPALPIEDQNDVTQQKAEPVKDANSLLGVPKEILEQLRDREKVRPRKVVKPLKQATRAAADVNEPKSAQEQAAGPAPPERQAMKQDTVLADRTAVLVKLKEGRFSFVLETLGWRAGQVSLQLLPCEALELTEQRQGSVPERVLFKVAGIRTEYKGRPYLLLQRAARVYSYGNFRSPVF